MRIERDNGDPVGNVVAICTREDLQHLCDSLVYFFAEEPPDPGWHCHVGGELTVAIAAD